MVRAVSFVVVLVAASALAQDGPGKGKGNGGGGGGGGAALLNFNCPEKNGFFPALDQCDLYYECVDNQAEPKLCPDGLLFKDGNPNQERCDYPFNVVCGDREFVQEPETDIDPRCYRANGFFNHESENECNKFYNCVNGVAYELPCATGLIFDEAQGTCVREEQASEFARKCEKSEEKEEIEGFSCPDHEVLGPHGQALAHPSFPHPLDCQKYITCFFGKQIQELGCPKGQVFDQNSLVCKLPEEGPEDCACWYECDPDSQCPDTCRSDCSCPDN